MCWLDLANAYSSVTLQHFYATPRFLNTVAHLYSDLSAVITSPSWVTSPIPLRIGVYKRDPLLVVIFNTVMSTVGESLYSFSNSPRSLTTLQYADDTCLVADGPSSCQKLLQHVELWLEWTGMRAKVSNLWQYMQHLGNHMTPICCYKMLSPLYWTRSTQVPRGIYPGSP